jgi:hypothetical protein
MSTLLTSPRAAFAFGESASDVTDLADRVADGHFDLDSEAFTGMISIARRRLVGELLIGILLDPAAPTVARQRAFGRLAATIATPQPALAHRAA